MIALCLLVLATLTASAQAKQKEPRVIFKREHDAPGFKRATTDAELQPLYEANLHADLACWLASERQRGEQLSIAQLFAQFRRMLPSRHMALLVFQNGSGSIFAANSLLMDTFVLNRMDRMREELQRLHASGHAVPDTLMIFNAEDEPICHRLTGGCTVPVFTLFKRWHPNTTAVAASVKPVTAEAAAAMGADVEILLPNFSRPWGSLFFYPWGLKNRTAFHRASLQKSMPANCSRVRLSALSIRDAETAGLLDVGIVKSTSSQVDASAWMKPYVGISKHARWRYLLSTDGHSASSRVGQLLGINSLLLKERSPWIEYYYRSLVAGQHLLEFGVEDILPQLKRLRAEEEEGGAAERIATAGQQFAYRYLHATAKAMYVRAAITEYNKLFQGMDRLRDYGDVILNALSKSKAKAVPPRLESRRAGRSRVRRKS